MATIDGEPCAWIEPHPSGWRWWTGTPGCHPDTDGVQEDYSRAWGCALVAATLAFGDVQEMPF